ncbi:MAG: methyltransferase [Desulfoplanes sp.]|nr:methyltransferase [Desulfoplanes sp.]
MNLTVASPVPAARDFFPRGLCQPDKGFRFSTDALLLACFADIKRGEIVVDLGTGCGVVGLGVLLRNSDLGIRIKGIDVEDEMVHAARANVRALEYDGQMEIFQGDVRDLGRIIPSACADVVVCNPPYRQPGRGKSCADALKTRARFEVRATLPEFVAGAGFMLKNRGRIYLVYLAEQLDLLFAAMQASQMVPKRVLPVHARPGEPARLVLVEGRKNGGQSLVMDSPLFLYQCAEHQTWLSSQALAFCPFLGCNAGDKRT